MAWRSLSRALEALAASSPSPILGLVYGSGFEDRPRLLTRIAARWALLGNDEATVERLKSPDRFFAELDRIGVAHPATASECPAKGERASAWLVKRKGGAGGSHIGVSGRAAKRGEVYYQERVEGRPVSALFVGDGRRGSRAWLQRAMDGAIQAEPMALWRRRPPCPSRSGGKDRDGRGGRARDRGLRHQGPRLSRFHGEERRRAPVGSQSAAGRHARHLRQPLDAARKPSSRCGDRGQASRSATQTQGRHGLGHRLCVAGRGRALYHDLARLGRRQAQSGRTYRQKPPDMHCVGPRGHEIPRQEAGRGAYEKNPGIYRE